MTSETRSEDDKTDLNTRKIEGQTRCLVRPMTAEHVTTLTKINIKVFYVGLSDLYSANVSEENQGASGMSAREMGAG